MQTARGFVGAHHRSGRSCVFDVLECEVYGVGCRLSAGVHTKAEDRVAGSDHRVPSVEQAVVRHQVEAVVVSPSVLVVDVADGRDLHGATAHSAKISSTSPGRAATA